MSRNILQLSPNTKQAKDPSPFQTFSLKSSTSELLLSKDQQYKKKSPKKPQKLTSIPSTIPDPQHRKSNSVSRTKQVTVNQLLSKFDLKEPQKTERSESSLSSLIEKWRILEEKIAEILTNLSIKRVESLKNTISESFFHCFSSHSLSSLAKLTVSDYFFSIFSAFRSASQELLSQTQTHTQEVETLKSENSKLKEDLHIYQIQLNQKRPINSPVPIKLPKIQSIDKMKTQFELEKAKLTEKLSVLESHLSQVASQSKSEKLLNELEKYKTLSETLQLKNDKLNQKIKTITYKFQCEVGEIKLKAKEDQDFVKKFTDVSATYELTINKLEVDKSVLLESVNRNRERVLMLGEEFNRLVGYREKYKKTQELANSMKMKYNQLELELIAGSSQRKTDSNSWVSFKGPLFEKIRGSVPFPDQNLFNSSQEPNSYKLTSPTFAGLLDLSEEKFIIEPLYPNWLEVHIRGIYDSKYTEHLLCTFESGRPPSRFPDFVFTWLGKFCIDDKSRQVSELEWWKKENIETIRVKFLSALKSANTSRIWELYTFNEFFTEELMVDELAFFLHCRHLVFQGHQLNLTQGKYSNVNYIGIDHLNSIIDSVLYKLGNSERLDIKMQLASKSRPQGSGNSVEAGFALRLLLEYYVREKKAKFLGMEETFLLAPKNFQGVISFKSFFSICQGLYTDVPEILVIKMHRLAWQVSKGQLNLQSFLLSAQEHYFFYYALQLRGNYKALKLTETLEIRESKENQMASEAYELYKRNKSGLNMVKEAIKGLGVTFLLENITKLEDLMQRKCQEPLEYYNGLHLHEVFSRLWKQVINIMIVYQETNQKYMSGIRNSVDLVKSTETFTKCLQGLLLTRVSTKVAIRKIQKIWKQRAKKAVAVAATVIKSITMFKRKIKK